MSLKKVLDRSKIILLVLQILVVRVEAILNDQPVTYASPDFHDAESLIPAYLLHGHWIVSLPHEKVGEDDWKIQPLVIPQTVIG